MRAFNVLRLAVMAAACAGLVACASDQPKPKKHPPLPGEEINELSWGGRPTGPNDVASPLGGLPMSR
jgi:hypothetical protein